MKPYYEDKESGIVIYHGDCRDILPQFPDKSFDLVLTDPPYNVGINYGVKTNDGREDFVEWMKQRFIEIERVSESVLISTGQFRLPDYAEIKRWKWLLAWWKPAAMGRCPVGFSNFEPVAFWGRGTNKSVDVVRAPIIPDDGLNGHPCPKPLAWASGFISVFPEASSILDPFMGSGTTLVAAKQLGRKAVGIEIEEKYCEIAVKRLAQMELFNQVKEV